MIFLIQQKAKEEKKLMIKFINSEKATKMDQISYSLKITYLVTSKTIVIFFQIIVAFSEYINFILQNKKKEL